MNDATTITAAPSATVRRRLRWNSSNAPGSSVLLFAGEWLWASVNGITSKSTSTPPSPRQLRQVFELPLRRRAVPSRIVAAPEARVKFDQLYARADKFRIDRQRPLVRVDCPLHVARGRERDAQT